MYSICEGLCHIPVAKHLSLTLSLYRDSHRHTHTYTHIPSENITEKEYKFLQVFKYIPVTVNSLKEVGSIRSFSLHSFNGTLVPVVEIHFVLETWSTTGAQMSCMAFGQQKKRFMVVISSSKDCIWFYTRVFLSATQ